MSKQQWVPLQRDYANELDHAGVPTMRPATDPLSDLDLQLGNSDGALVAQAPETSVDIDEPEPESEGGATDPLSDPLGEGDPLNGGGGPVADTFGSNIVGEDEEENVYEEGFVPWAERREKVLSEYQTDKTITIANLKNIDNVDDAAEAQQARATMPASRERSRLDELENSETEGQRQLLLLTCSEYTAHVRQLNSLLTQAWKTQERVKAVKLAIQNAKLLADATVLQFYPSMFVLVTDLLDNFGKLVFDRIHERGAGLDPKTGAQLPPLGKRFSHKQVSDLAKETCRNWFYKIASVKELLPRLFVEIAIVKCYMFLEPEKRFPKLLLRLANICRGIGDPLIACYARAYLVRQGRDLMRTDKGYIGTCVEDILFTFDHQVKTEQFRESVQRKGCSVVEYYHLYSPALDFLFHCLGYQAPPAIYDGIYMLFSGVEGEKSSIVLNYLLRNFPAEEFMANALQMTKMLKETDSMSFPKHRLYATWAKCMVESAPPHGDLLKILNEAWKVLTKQENLLSYLEAAGAYIEYVLKYFSDKEINVMLKDVIVHVKAKQETLEDAVYDDQVLPLVKQIVEHCLAYMPDFGRLIMLDKFMPLLDLFRKQSKYEVFKSMLGQFGKQKKATGDPVVVHAMFDVSRNLHDMLDAMSMEDERKQVAHLIIAFIDKVEFGKDLEKALNFYVDCREGCSNLDTVVNHVVFRMASLGVRAHHLVKGKHNRRTTAFAKACLAACYVTIPTSEHLVTRLHLFLLCGKVSLMNGLITQAESFFKQCIQTVKEIPSLLDSKNIPLPFESQVKLAPTM
jgi:hypothetical protein